MYAVMAGLKGCMPIWCERYDTVRECVDAAKCVYDLSSSVARELRRNHYVDLECRKARDFEGKLVLASVAYGNEYLEIQEVEDEDA